MKTNKNVEQEVLPKKVLEICNFTEEEIEMLKDADALVATVDRLPDNPDKLIDRIIKEFPDDVDGAWKKFAEVIQKDPKFLAQIIALNEVSNTVTEEPPATVEKMSTAEVKTQNKDEVIANIMATLGYKK